MEHALTYYTRRSVKTTKYIDTITSERIKWINIIRDEVTTIYTNVYYTLEACLNDINIQYSKAKQAHDTEESDKAYQDFENWRESHFEEWMEQEIRRQEEETEQWIKCKGVDPNYKEPNINDFRTKMENLSILAKRKELWSKSDFIKHLCLFKLRLNRKDKDDEEIIIKIDYFTEFYTKGNWKNKEELEQGITEINLLIDKMQILLKKEWDRVKDESIGGTYKTSKKKWYARLCGIFALVSK